MDAQLRALIQDVVDSTYSTGGVSIITVDKLADYLAANPVDTESVDDVCGHCK